MYVQSNAAEGTKTTCRARCDPPAGYVALRGGVADEGCRDSKGGGLFSARPRVIRYGQRARSALGLVWRGRPKHGSLTAETDRNLLFGVPAYT